jgi:hypothetical protein
VHVVVVSVVVRVGVLVLELHMLVFVAVRLEQMQNNARQHQRATNDHPGAQPAVTARTAVISIRGDPAPLDRARGRAAR